MNSINCKYHPLSPARWSCPDCQVHFCTECGNKDARRNEVECPLCKQSLQQVDASNFIVPFWKRLPRFFLYPANLSSLLLIFGVAVLVSISSGAHLLSTGFQLAFFALFLTYAMAVLDRTANGNLEAGVFSVDTLTGQAALALKQMLVFAGMYYVLRKLIMNFEFTAARVLLYSFMFLLPAQIMLLVTRRSLLASISPFSILMLFRRIGVPYLLMFGCLFLLASSWEYIALFIARQRVPMGMFVQSMVWLYFVLIMFNLMGYVIFQYHEKLGFEVRLEVDQELEAETDARPERGHPAMTNAEVLIREGRIEEAIAELSKQSRQYSRNLEIHRRLYELLKRRPDHKDTLEAANHLINILIEEGQTGKATDVCQECQRLDVNFRIANPDAYLPVMKNLKGRMAFQSAIDLGSDFHDRYPDHYALPEVYFVMAQILAENLNDDRKALEVLEYLRDTFPDHALQPQVQQNIMVIRRLLDSSAAS